MMRLLAKYFSRKTIILLLLATALAVTPQCARSSITGEITRDPHNSSGYWTGNHTYQYSAASGPTRGLSGKKARRDSSFKMAVENARHMIRQRFIGMSLEGCPSPMLSDPDAVQAAHMITEIIKKGKVIKKEYDNEDNCEVVFQVTLPDLKTIAHKAAWEYP